jgi:hypothetical protein
MGRGQIHLDGATRLTCVVRLLSALSDRTVFATSDKPRLVGVGVPGPAAFDTTALNRPR